MHGWPCWPGSTEGAWLYLSGLGVCCYRLVEGGQNSEEEGSSRKEGYRVQDSPESEPFIIFLKKMESICFP